MTPPIRPSAPDFARAEVAARTDTGSVRSHNEDSHGTFQRPDGTRLLVVADGMGGHRGGATASRVTVEVLGEAFEVAPAKRGLSQAWLSDTLQAANGEVHAAAADDPALRGMGTTVVCALVTPDGAAHVCHVGDSRAYLLREGALTRLTEDHSVVAEMLRRGLLTEEEADVHPRRNEILRSVGVEAEVVPETREIGLLPGDTLLLCSDGLCGVLSDAEIASRFDRPGERGLDEIAADLIDEANARGGPDNITVVALRASHEATSEAQTGMAPRSEPPGSYTALALLAALVGGLALFTWILWS